jgi:lysophospholipase L1-like esterase
MLNLPSCFRLAALVACLGAFAAVRATAGDAKPTIFVIGDSTARNNAKGMNGEPCLGWGNPIADFFDETKVEVANVAHAGQSSRTYFIKEADWPSVHPRIKAGDFVLLVFGINDGSGAHGRVTDRGSLPGIGDETIEMKDASGKVVETAHTYGWYMTEMAKVAREKGAHVTFLTVTTRNIWTNPKAKFRDAKPTAPLPADYDPKEDRIERGTSNGQYTQWTKDLGAKLHIPVLDLTNLCADRYEAMGREAVDKLYSDHNHTYVAGAQVVAESIVSGLKAFPNSPFVPLLSEKGKAVPTADAKYVSANAAR